MPVEPEPLQLGQHVERLELLEVEDLGVGQPELLDVEFLNFDIDTPTQTGSLISRCKRAVLKIYTKLTNPSIPHDLCVGIPISHLFTMG